MLNGLMRILGRAGLGVGLASAVAALVPTAAAAADPGRWDLVDRSTIPLVYFQGVTSAPDGDLFFDGINTGLYRSNSQLAEEARIANVIPSEVGTAESYNHVGDITYDAADGGRILLPLECYYPGTPSGANTCETGSIGVADPDTLQWQYYVKLDPAYDQEGDVGGGLPRRQRALDPAGQRPAGLRHGRHQRCERRP